MNLSCSARLADTRHSLLTVMRFDTLIMAVLWWANAATATRGKKRVGNGKNDVIRFSASGSSNFHSRLKLHAVHKS